MRKILISGYHGFNNLGDEAILESILQAFKRAAAEEGRRLAVTVLSADPGKTARNNNGVRSVGRTNLPAILKAIKNCDLFLSGGGSLLQDKTGYGLSVAYYLGLVFLARLMKKKTVLYAQGIGPITKRINRLIARRIINKVDLVTVRDVDSYKELLSLGIKKPPVHVTVDPAFSLRPSPDNDNEKLQRLFPQIPPDKPLLGISVRGWLDHKKFIREIAKAADRLVVELGAAAVIIPMFPEQDLPVSRDTASLMEQEAYVAEEELTPQKALFLFSHLDLFIGVRLHSLIFAAITGTPLAGVAYDPKVQSFLSQMGLNPVHRVEDLKSEDLYNHCLQLWSQREEISSGLRQAAAEHRRQSSRFADSVYRYFFGENEMEVL